MHQHLGGALHDRRRRRRRGALFLGLELAARPCLSGARRRHRRARRATSPAPALIRPWLFLGPALLVLGLYLVYPVFASLWLQLPRPQRAGLRRARQLPLGCRRREFRESLLNNLLWLLVVPAASTFLGLVIAVLTDRIWWGNIAKSLIFMPMAISFVGASVIWKFVYDYRGEGSDADRPAERHRRGLRRRAAGLDRAAVLEQFLPDGDPDLDPDRLRHGHPVGRPARHPGGDDRGRRHRRRQWLPDLLPDHGPADLGHHRRRLDDDHHHRAQGLRHRARHDQRPVEHARSWPT